MRTLSEMYTHAKFQADKSNHCWDMSDINPRQTNTWTLCKNRYSWRHQFYVRYKAIQELHSCKMSARLVKRVPRYVGLCVKTDAQMDTSHRGKVRGQCKMVRHQFTCDPIMGSSFEKIGPVVSEEFSGNERGGGGTRSKTQYPQNFVLADTILA